MFSSSRGMACLSVVGPNATVLAAVNVISLKEWAQLALIVLSILYTLWRWRRDSCVMCDACRNGVPLASCSVPLGKRPPWCPRVNIRVLTKSDQI